jgi:hypothetical protein
MFTVEEDISVTRSQLTFDFKKLKNVDKQTMTPKSKGKSIPVLVWIGPEGSRRLRLPDFVTAGT